MKKFLYVITFLWILFTLSACSIIKKETSETDETNDLTDSLANITSSPLNSNTVTSPDKIQEYYLTGMDMSDFNIIKNYEVDDKILSLLNKWEKEIENVGYKLSESIIFFCRIDNYVFLELFTEEGADAECYIIINDDFFSIIHDTEYDGNMYYFIDDTLQLHIYDEYKKNGISHFCYTQYDILTGQKVSQYEELYDIGQLDSHNDGKKFNCNFNDFNEVREDMRKKTDTLYRAQYMVYPFAIDSIQETDIEEIKGLIDFSKKNISFKTKMLKIDVFDLDSDGTKDLVCFGIDEDMNIKSGCFFSFDKQTGQYCLNTDLFYRYPLMAYGKYRNQSEEEFYIVLHTRSTRVGNTFTMRNMNGETSTLFFDSVFDNRKDNSLTPFYEVNNFVGKCLDCEIPYTKIEHVNWECLVSEEDYCRLRSELVSAVEFVPTNILTVTIAYEQYSDLDADEIFEKLKEEELVDCFTGDNVSKVTNYSYLNQPTNGDGAFSESGKAYFNEATENSDMEVASDHTNETSSDKFFEKEALDISEPPIGYKGIDLSDFNII